MSEVFAFIDVSHLVAKDNLWQRQSHWQKTSKTQQQNPIKMACNQ